MPACPQTDAYGGRVADVHFTFLRAMLMPSSEGKRHDTHACALPPLSHRPGHEGWQDQSAHLKHDPGLYGKGPFRQLHGAFSVDSLSWVATRRVALWVRFLIAAG